MDTCRCRVICALAVLSSASALLTSPPRIVNQPLVEELLFQVAQPGDTYMPFIIDCDAEGEPAPKYRWIKNGKPLEYSSYDNRFSQQPGRGTLVVSRPTDEDIGQYQCFASNEWGTATSNSVFVRKAELNDFNETDGTPKTITAQEGLPFKLICVPPKGHPKPKVYWMLQGDQGELKTINNSRMTLDPEGNLLFSNVTRNDASVDYAYICVAKSLLRNEYKIGNKVYLEVEQTGISMSKHEPVRQYVTRKVETALKGRKTELYCIYGGTPLPQVVWQKDGRPIPSSQNITQDDYGKPLVIERTSYEDQGTYTCEVSNGVGSAQSYSIQLNVEALPDDNRQGRSPSAIDVSDTAALLTALLSASSRRDRSAPGINPVAGPDAAGSLTAPAPFFTEEPQFQNMAEGETAVIRCKAGGTPDPQITWIQNGRPIEKAEPYPRRTVTEDSIIIKDLTKKDTGNYGCNATNSFGYVYKDVYVNVYTQKEKQLGKL